MYVVAQKTTTIKEPIRSRSENMYNFDMLVVDDNDHVSISDDTANVPLLDIKILVAQHRRKPKRTNAPSASDKELKQLVKIHKPPVSAPRGRRSPDAPAWTHWTTKLDCLQNHTIRRALSHPNDQQNHLWLNCRQDQTYVRNASKLTNVIPDPTVCVLILRSVKWR